MICHTNIWGKIQVNREENFDNIVKNGVNIDMFYAMRKVIEICIS